MVIAVGEDVATSFPTSLTGGSAISTDGGKIWRGVGPTLSAAGGAWPSYASVAIDPTSAQTIWIGSGGALAIDTRLFRSDDGGSTWRAAATWAAGGQFGAPSITAIAIDPQDARRMIVAIPSFGARIFGSIDQSATWIQLGNGIDASLTVQALAVDWAAAPRVIYVGTQKGVYASAVDGTWLLVPGSQDMAISALQIARPAAGVDRMTIIAATDTGVHEFTADPSGKFVPVYRFFNTATSAHFYTASGDERAYVLAHYPTFQDEGIAYWTLAAAAPGATPVFRFFNTITGTHFYTADPSERDFVLATYPQFTPEGTAYYAFGNSEPGTVPAHRFFNTQTGTHFYTSSDDEVLYVQQHFLQFVYEGIRYGVYPAVPR